MGLGDALGGFALGDLVARIRIDTSDLKSAQGEADGFGSKLKSSFAVGAAAVAAGSVAIADFAKTSIDKYQEVGSATRQLMTLTGGSAEQMSRLNFAAQETGVGTDLLGSSIKKLSTGIETNNKHVIDSGIAFRNAKGDVLPMDQALGNVAAKFASMPNGIAKNTLAVELFGKSGTQLLPFLNKGRDGLAALEAEADKFGLTLTQNNLDALTKNKQAHKEFAAAVEGLQVQFGVHLLPVINQFIELGTKYLIPVITEATHVLDLVLTPVLRGVGNLFDKTIGPAIQGVATYLDGEGTEAWRVLHGFLHDSVEPILETIGNYLSGTFSSAWSGIRDLFRNDIKPALGDVSDKFNNDVLPAIQGAAQWVSDHFGPLISGGIDTAKTAASEFWTFVTKTAIPDIQSTFQGLADGFGGNIGSSLSTVWDGAQSALQGFWDLVKNALPDLKDAASFVGSAVSTVTGVLGFGGGSKKGSAGSNAPAPGGPNSPAGKNPSKSVGSALGSVGGIAGAVGITTGLLASKDPLKDISAGFKDLTKTNLGEFLDGAKTKIAGLIPDFLALGGSADGAGAALTVLDVPLIVIVAALAAVAAGAIYAYTHFKTFHDIVNTVASTLASAVSWVVANWPTISRVIGQVFSDIAAVAVPIFKAAADLISGIVSSVVEFFRTHWAEISDIVQTYITIVSTEIEIALAVIGVIVAVALDAIKELWSVFGGAITTIVEGIWTVISTAIQTAVNLILDIIGIGLDILTGHWGQAWDDLGKLLTDAWDGFTGILSGYFQVVEGIFDAGLAVVTRLWSSAWDGLRGAFDAVWNGIKAALGGVIGIVVGDIGGLPGKLLAAIPNPGGILKGVGNDIVDGLVQGLKDSWHFVTDKLSDLTKLIPGPVRSLLGINSPSKVFMGIGSSIPEGMALGVDTGAAQVHRSIANLVQIPNISVGGTSAGGGGSTSTSTVTRNYTINTYGTDLDPNEIGAALRRMELVYG